MYGIRECSSYIFLCSLHIPSFPANPSKLSSAGQVGAIYGVSQKSGYLFVGPHAKISVFWGLYRVPVCCGDNHMYCKSWNDYNTYSCIFLVCGTTSRQSLRASALPTLTTYSPPLNRWNMEDMGTLSDLNTGDYRPRDRPKPRRSQQGPLALVCGMQGSHKS